MKKTHTEESSVPTSQNSMEQIMEDTEDKLNQEQEQLKLKRIMEDQISGFRYAMSDTIKEVMEGSHGSK